MLRRLLGSRAGRAPPDGYLGDHGTADVLRPGLRVLRPGRRARGGIGGPPRRPSPQQRVHAHRGHLGPRLPVPAQPGRGAGPPADPAAHHRAHHRRRRDEHLLRRRATHPPITGVVRILRTHLHLLPRVHGQGLLAPDVGPVEALGPQEPAPGPAHDVRGMRLRPRLRRLQGLRPGLHRARTGPRTRARPLLDATDSRPVHLQRDRSGRRRTPHHHRAHPPRPAVAHQPTAPSALGAQLVHRAGALVEGRHLGGSGGRARPREHRGRHP